VGDPKDSFLTDLVLVLYQQALFFSLRYYVVQIIKALSWDLDGPKLRKKEDDSLNLSQISFLDAIQ
jgi:hypothetical protein